MENKVYQMVTDRIIEQMQKGIIPWRKPWHKSLKNDPKMIIWASSRAEKAAEFIWGQN